MGTRERPPGRTSRQPPTPSPGSTPSRVRPVSLGPRSALAPQHPLPSPPPPYKSSNTIARALATRGHSMDPTPKAQPSTHASQGIAVNRSSRGPLVTMKGPMFFIQPSNRQCTAELRGCNSLAPRTHYFLASVCCAVGGRGGHKMFQALVVRCGSCVPCLRSCSVDFIETRSRC
jgi:hypothetical protein